MGIHQQFLRSWKNDHSSYFSGLIIKPADTVIFTRSLVLASHRHVSAENEYVLEIPAPMPTAGLRTQGLGAFVHAIVVDAQLDVQRTRH
jgi:hypothetical protein